MVPRSFAVLLALVAALVAATPAEAVVGGRATTGGPGSYPWQVAVVTTSSEDAADQWLCGGTLVSPTLVLTAAHCITEDDGRISVPGDVYVLNGSTRLNDSDASDGDVMTFTRVTDVGLYPGIDMSGRVPDGDLAMLHLAAAPPDGRPLGVVGADETSLWDVGDRLRITGWGVTSATSTTVQNTLRWASVNRIADDSCASDYGSDFNSATMLCAGVPGGGVDTCYGDSGGPLLAPATDPTDITDPSTWRLAGVTSWGTGCGDEDKPGVYAKLGNPQLAAFANDGSPSWAPVNTSAPALPASATAGGTITCTPGTWTGSDISLTYEFRRVTTGGSTTLAQSGPSNTYTVTAADASGIVCVELARTAGGTAWAQSGSTSVTVPAPPVTPTVPTTQVPGAEIPRTPVTPGVDPGFTGQASNTDGASPRVSRLAARCKSRRCTISLRVTDAAPSSGIKRVTGTVTWKQSCRRKGHRKTCRRTARVTATKKRGTTWALRLPRLPRGTASISIVAVDKSGRIGTSARKLTFRV